MDGMKQLVILPLLLNTVRRRRNVHTEKHKDEGWGEVGVASSGFGITFHPSTGEAEASVYL